MDYCTYLIESVKNYMWRYTKSKSKYQSYYLYEYI